MIKLQGLFPCLFASCVRSSSKRRFAIFQSLSRGFVYSALSSFNRFLFSALLPGLFLSILQALLYSPFHSPSRIVFILFKHYCILLFILLQGRLYLSFKHCILLSTLSFKDSCCIYPSSIVFSPLQSPSRIVSILHAIVFSSPQSPSWIVCIYPSSIIVFSSPLLSFRDCLYAFFKASLYFPPHSPSRFCIVLSSTTLLQSRGCVHSETTHKYE